MSRWPSDAARWRFELERFVGDESGLWRRAGWDLRMRRRRGASLA